jgi:hypothetical protein
VEIPIEQLMIGIFGLFGAVVTGAFSIYKIKVEKKISKVEKKSKNNGTLVLGNDLLDQIVPALERKDEALDKIAEILDNILMTQTLTAQQLRSIQLVMENRCQALDILKAIQSIASSQKRHSQVDSLGGGKTTETMEEVLDEVVSILDGSKSPNLEMKGGEYKD